LKQQLLLWEATEVVLGGGRIRGFSLSEEPQESCNEVETMRRVSRNHGWQFDYRGDASVFIASVNVDIT
jgi:hypothetical protein